MRDVRNNEMSNLWYSQYLLNFLMCNILHSHFPVQSATCKPIGHVYLVKYK